MLEKYLKSFSNLRTDKNRDRYPAITDHRAPHKPFLLLSIMDLITQGQITSNFIEPSLDLVYLHRYNEGTLSRMRTEYVIPLQENEGGLKNYQGHQRCNVHRSPQGIREGA